MKTQCRRRGLHVTGTKRDLVSRLGSGATGLLRARVMLAWFVATGPAPRALLWKEDVHFVSGATRAVSASASFAFWQSACRAPCSKEKVPRRSPCGQGLRRVRMRKVSVL